MAQINLLKQTAVRPSPAASFFRLVPMVFGVAFLVLLLYYGWLFIYSGQLAKKTSDIESQISQESAQAMSNPRRGELLTRQLQLKDLSGLVAAHVYWSQIFPVLAQVTLKQASYNSIRVDPTSGTVSLTAQVPTLDDLDRYMQVFNLPAFYKYFSDVKVSGFTNAQTSNGSVVSFTVQMRYNSNIIQYQANQ